MRIENERYQGTLQNDAPHVFDAEARATNYYRKVLANVLPPRIEFTDQGFADRQGRPGREEDWFYDAHETAS